MAGPMRTVSFKIPTELDVELNRLASERGESRSAVVRSAIGALRAAATPSFAALASDLICLGEVPSDLSTNDAYLEDLGK